MFWVNSLIHRFISSHLLGQTDPTTIDNTIKVHALSSQKPKVVKLRWILALKWEWYISPETFLKRKRQYKPISKSLPFLAQPRLGLSSM